MTVATRSAGETTLSDVKERAEALVPRLRERAGSAEQLRRLPDETFQDFVQAGLFRVLQPARFGGFELDYGRTQVELCHILGRGCGSSAWVQCVIACHAWCVAMFSQAAQKLGREPRPKHLAELLGHPLNGVRPLRIQIRAFRPNS